MKHIITALFILMTTTAHAAEVLPGPYPATSLSVYDGDTFNARVQIWLGQMVFTSIRINGMDTPEKRGKCPYEKALALQARDALQELLKGDVQLTDVRYGKWAGRVLATVTADGVNVSDVLINMGLARPYDGGKRQSWCNGI